ncbi:uncharacterized protein LOC111043110 [Myzus persicae]|uniref:uncharacterized protein LOC111043110 n=1 Tax=Myzus persicae TaxID=13164 RepID=UPI000B9390DA|nr:uncharacterized protein LOC111043110 [Myzus persicae]
MADRSPSTNPPHYLKVIKTFNRSGSNLRNRVNDAIDDLAIQAYTDKMHCQLCAIFIVMTARNSCCSICFKEWMNEYDDDDNPNDNIKCKKCDRPIKNALDNRSLDFLCNLVGLNEKKKPGGHFGYPVLGIAAMDLLFESIKIESETLDNDSETNITD